MLFADASALSEASKVFGIRASITKNEVAAKQEPANPARQTQPKPLI